MIESFTSTEFLMGLLVQRHGLTQSQSKGRTRQIVPHIRTAIRFLRQSLDGPAEVAFLPTYYAFLNLAKVYVLLGPRHADLASQRYHGASYKGFERNSQSLLTEEVELHPKGALPLFYETVTSVPVQGAPLKLKMAEVYPFIADIGSEYNLATGTANQLAGVSFRKVMLAGAKARLDARVVPQVPPQGISGLDVRLLIGYRRETADPNHVRFSSLEVAEDAQTVENMRKSLRLFLLYHGEQTYVTPLSRRRLFWPEEFPILIAFFHMSSVVRYKPEFLERLRDSRFWPMLAAARRHCLRKFLVLFWSFMQQQTLHMEFGG